jgi:imidazole glycerol phosphate synthase subunit HisF
MGTTSDMVKAFEQGADAAAMADILHYGRIDLPAIRDAALDAGYAVRSVRKVTA